MVDEFKLLSLLSLAVKDENKLNLLLQKAASRQIQHTAFREPDLNNSLTVIALELCDSTRKLISNLLLVFKNIITL